jgi:hypothetical protein
MSNWWNDLVAGLEQATSEGKIGYTPQYVNYQPGFRGSVIDTKTSSRKDPKRNKPTAQMIAAANKQQRDLQALGGAGSLRAKVGNELTRQTNVSQPEAYSFQQFMADMVAGMSGGGGGGVDLSGYNEMLSDISGREASLGTRRGEQEAFLNSLFEAAQGRMTTDQEGLAAAVQAALESDQARRATEIGLVRGADAERLATANAARGALGVEGGPDLSSAIAENAVAGVGASGSVSERDARIRESIERQQLQNQIAGLTPMQQMASTSLSRGYEDRLGALASERAAIKAQMAQARSAPRGGGGVGFSDLLNAQKVYSDLYGPGEAPQFGGALGSAEEIRQFFGPAANDVLGIANRILTGARTSTLDPTTLAGASELLTGLATADPSVQKFLNDNPVAPGAIIKYIVESQ